MKKLYTEEQEKQIVQDYRGPGATMLSVGDKWGCSESTVRDILSRQGEKTKSRKTIANMSRDTRIFRDYLSGKTVGFLSGKYQLSPPRVCAILNDIQPDRRKLSWS